MKRIVAVLFVTGCGGHQTAATAAGPDCKAVAAHLVELAERDNGAAASASLASDLGNELERNCRDDAWSAERRTCLADAPDQEATLACPTE
jgi:hypothetical protein